MYEIYGRDNCVWCERAKALLADLNEPYEYHNIEENSNHLQNFQTIFKNARSVPQILYWKTEPSKFFIIGGYSNLAEWLRDKSWIY